MRSNWQLAGRGGFCPTRPGLVWVECQALSGVRRPAGAVHFPASLAPVRSGSREVSEKFANKITKIQK